MFDFDTAINRQNTHALKYEKYKGMDVLPMWIADMEFRPPKAVIDALKKRLEHGVFGYTEPWDALNQSAIDWISEQHNWNINPDWIVWLPGVVPGFNAVVRAFCEKGKKVSVQTPNYPPLLDCAKLNNLASLNIGVIIKQGRWTIDFPMLEEHLSNPDCSLFILCNPMNPNGTVLTGEELNKVVNLCKKHSVVLCSDEIHCDLLLDPSAKHIPAGSLYEDSITLMSASKTFNFAGLSCAFAIIPNPEIRKKLLLFTEDILPWPSLMGYLATEAAFSRGHEWHQSLLQHLRSNRDNLARKVNSIKGLSLIPPQATFLAWIDATELDTRVNRYEHFLNSGIATSAGEHFGLPDFVRINFGCSRETLTEALGRLDNLRPNE